MPLSTLPSGRLLPRFRNLLSASRIPIDSYSFFLAHTRAAAPRATPDVDGERWIPSNVLPTSPVGFGGTRGTLEGTAPWKDVGRNKAYLGRTSEDLGRCPCDSNCLVAYYRICHV